LKDTSATVVAEPILQLQRHDPDATSDVNAWPTPRSWEMASNVLNGFARRQQSGFFAGTTEIEAQLLEGTIGEAATTELVAFLRLFRELPSIDEILLNPDAAPLPDEPSALVGCIQRPVRWIYCSEAFCCQMPLRSDPSVGWGVEKRVTIDLLPSGLWKW
jgi:hypothetical protein